MKRLSPIVFVVALSQLCIAQVGGGSAVYNQSQTRGPQAAEQAKRNLSKEEMPPTANGMFLDASILINVKADEHVAVFGLNQEGATIAECNQKMATTLAQFSADVKKLGVADGDVFVDFIAQNRIYGFEVAADIAKEKVTGFELKKNVSIHYKSHAMLDKLIAAAARAKIFDLIKVDYIVKDTEAVHDKLMDDATRVIKRKVANHERLLGIKLRPPAQVYAERYSSYYPTEMYESYTAFESEDIDSNYLRQKFTVQRARKPRTFYLDALDAKSFDHVLNPVVVEPVVQFTLYLKVLYTVGEASMPVHPQDAARICMANLQTMSNALLASRVKNPRTWEEMIRGGINTANLPDLDVMPICPTGGHYSLEKGKETFRFRCSHSGHGSFEPGIHL